MYMKKILTILIIILLPIFSLIIYFIYNEMKISNEIAKIEENIEKLYKKNKLDEFCEKDYRLEIRKNNFLMKLILEKKNNVWEGKYKLNDKIFDIVYRNDKFYYKNTEREISELKDFKFYFQYGKIDKEKLKDMHFFNAFLAPKDSFYYKDGIIGKYIERKKVNFDSKETEYIAEDTSTIYIRYDVNDGKSSVVIEEIGENIREECGLVEENMIKLH
ncbi:hypothetical protein JMUB5056_0908 [Leptotrichia hongkongensis]|uniref:Lipoprotein n=2 Tax=Leptotrichia hongkongensis TaxID=554406 RepID=A0A510L5R6_9FUSO|nr:hypothetical protein JMUB5056_0908 [Leptotrichia hongkongensis]